MMTMMMMTTMTMTMSHENPWESAANDRQYRNRFSLHDEFDSHENATESPHDHHSYSDVEEGPTEGLRSHSMRTSTSNVCRTLLLLWTLLDVVAGLAWLIGMVYVESSSHDPTTNTVDDPSLYPPLGIRIMFISMGIGWTIRGFLVWLLMTWRWKNCGHSWMGMITILLALTYILLGCISLVWIHNQTMETRIQWIPSPFLPLLKRDRYLVLRVGFFLLAVMEWIHGMLIQRQLQLLQLQDSYSNDSSFQRTHPDHSQQQQQQYRKRSIPWWWQTSSNNPMSSELSESLLISSSQDNPIPHWAEQQQQYQQNHHHQQQRRYQQDHGLDTTTTTTTTTSTSGFWMWPFSFGRTTRGNNSSTSRNVRDDGSVDYASLSEDWQSRSEQDPFWWTKEDEELRQRQQQQQQQQEAGPNWINEQTMPSQSQSISSSSPFEET